MDNESTRQEFGESATETQELTLEQQLAEERNTSALLQGKIDSARTALQQGQEKHALDILS